MTDFLEKPIARISLEFLGTAFLAYTIIVLGRSSLSPFQQSCGVGLCVSLLIHILGRYSGAHLNPAVSLVLRFQSTGLAGFLKSDGALETIGYVAAQIAGACLGMKLAIGNNGTFHPGGVLDGVIQEVVLTVILLILIIVWSHEGRICPFAQPLSGIVIGGGIVLLSIVGGVSSSGVMNPAIAIGLMLNTSWHGLAALVISQTVAICIVMSLLHLSKTQK